MPNQLRSAAVYLVTCLYVDSKPQSEKRIPNLIRCWSKVDMDGPVALPAARAAFAAANGSLPHNLSLVAKDGSLRRDSGAWDATAAAVKASDGESVTLPTRQYSGTIVDELGLELKEFEGNSIDDINRSMTNAPGQPLRSFRELKKEIVLHLVRKLPEVKKYDRY